MGQDLEPDNAILSAVFPHAKPVSVTILAKTFDTCKFRAQFDTQPCKDWPMDLIVYMQIFDDVPVLEVVTALGRAANHQFPGLVPETFTCKKALTSDGRDVEYTVARYLTGTVTLEKVWPSLLTEQKESLVDAIVMAAKQVHTLKSTDPVVKELLADTPFVNSDGGICIGGPRSGYSKNIREFLTHLVEKNQLRRSPTSDIVENASGLLIHSSLPELGQVLLTNEDIDSLGRNIVLSHNDIEPRNISVQAIMAEDGSTNYELVGLVDCHRAGFFPFAFETAEKDLSLGNENLFLDWYMLFKEKTRSMIPPGGASEKLIRAARIITKSKCMQQKTSVMAEFRRRWLEKEGLDLSDDVLTGWERTKSNNARGQEPWVFSLEENIRLYDQVAQDCQ
ncbi:uncharacterized protein EKO05_0003693 [Ascochyta rabiei]|uniref:Transferase n=1 Tax=Didymella rabiei TaxID=5454 RepID=A0A162YXA3_DIDRA|nr:uncharacterized protein EKO05_0003693 [Ascochyta rabiei]KZM20283.1 transferase [Ascochyta rabiei]UPX13167.1 hypothetical protein EKO05_0003693 [Ascochyta rabiei]